MQLILSFILLYWVGDSSAPYQLIFQDPMNLHLFFVIISIVIVIAWLFYSILVNFTEFNQSSVPNFVRYNSMAPNVETVQISHQCESPKKYRVVRLVFTDGVSYIMSIEEFNLVFKLKKDKNKSLTELYLIHFWLKYLEVITREDGKHVKRWPVAGLVVVVYGFLIKGPDGLVKIVDDGKELEPEEFYTLYTVDEPFIWMAPLWWNDRGIGESFEIFVYTVGVNAYMDLVLGLK